MKNNNIKKIKKLQTNENSRIMEDIVTQLIEHTIIQANNKQQTENITEKITINNMITNNSKSKKQLKINNFFCTEKQETTKQKITRNSELITTPKFKLEQTTKKSLPKA